MNCLRSQPRTLAAGAFRCPGVVTAMATIPEPRPTSEHPAPPCRRHHVHMVNCPDCCAWHRDHLRAQRHEAQRQRAEREAAT